MFLTTIKRTFGPNFRRYFSSKGLNNDLFLSERHGDKVVLTFNRPKQLNSHSLAMQDQMFETLQGLDADRTVRLAILKGAGGNFSAGGDVKEFTTKLESESEYQMMRRGSKVYNRCLLYTHEFKVPLVSLADGICMGGGAGYAFLSPYSVVTERTVFSMPEVFIGYYPDSGSCYFLGRQLGPVGLYLGLTGTRLIGSQIVTVGLSNTFVSSANLHLVERSLLDLHEPTSEDVEQLLRSSHETTEVALPFDVKQVDELFNADSVEAIVQGLRKDESEWAKKTLKLLLRLPPSSLKLTFHLFQKVKNEKLSVEQSLVLCNTIFNNCYDNKEYRRDFVEGVRAVLVDKGSKPTWTPATLEELDDNLIKAMFQPLYEIR